MDNLQSAEVTAAVVQMNIIHYIFLSLSNYWSVYIK